MELPLEKKALYRFFRKNIKDTRNLNIMEDLEESTLALFHKDFTYDDRHYFDKILAKSVIIDLCKWPPVFNRNGDGDTCLDVIIDEAAFEFIEVLMKYLEHKYPNKYKYNKQNKRIELNK